MTEQLKSHPAAESFPMMGETRYQELLEDIRERGLLESITLCDGMILDGRNRYKAAVELNIKPNTRNFEGDPWAFAWSMNGQRRDLVAEQRYLIWKECQEKSKEWQQEQERIKEEANKKRSEATKKATRDENGTFVSGPVVEQSVPPPAKKTHKIRGTKAILSKTNRGAVQRGDKLAKERPDLAEKVQLGEMKPAEAHRQMKKDQVIDKIAELPSDKYVVIYADPPWKYEDGRTGEGMTATGALHHYPTMRLSELKALDIPKLAAENSVLFLWATCPLLEDALELARAWGFKYKAQFVWDKVKHNMGHYNSVRHELLLVCTRGSCTPQSPKLLDSVQSIERTDKHSQKPEEFRKIIDTLYPKGNRIELFARAKVPDNWQTWGNEKP